VKPSLQGYAAAILGAVPAGEMRQVATQMRAVHDLVADNAELFTALTDTAVPAAVRRAVVDDILQDKVSEPVRRVSVFAAGAVAAPEVPPALDWVCVHAGQMADGDVRPAPTLGLLAARQRVGGFAKAVLEELATEDLDDIEDELFRFARTVESIPALRRALGDRDLPMDARHGIVEDLLAGKVRPATLRLVRYAVEGGRARDIVGTLDFLVEETARARGWRVATVRAGQPMDEDERSDLSAALTRLAGSPVELQVTVDPHLLSGVLVRVGDLQVDATARGRLDALREHMTNGSWDQASYARPDLDAGPDGDTDDTRDTEGAR
jgi:F-type H+-transporting ATPase subunit delta